MGAPEPLTPVTVAALLRAQLLALQAEIQALPASLCRWRPGPEEWCINEGVGHLIESERRGFNGRIRLLLAGGSPSLPGWDQVAIAQERQDDQREPADLLAEFVLVRDDSVRLVSALTPDQLERYGEHEQVGRITIADLLHEWVHHDRNHVRQLLAVMQAYAWPHMGNCQRFSLPH